MGITLHAQVEIFEPGRPEYDIAPHWHDLARWDFGKDGNASIALFNCPMVRRGWPPDACIEAEEAEIFDEGRQYVEANYLPVVPGSRLIWQAFEASLLVLIGQQERTVRVLFWRM